MNERKVWLDWLRFIATIAVIILHSASSRLFFSYGTQNWIEDCIYDGFVRWSVPVFFMISGALLLNPSKEISIKSLLKYRIPRVLYAYLFWWCLYSLFSFVFGQRGISIFQPYYHLWFLPMLICVYLFIPVLRLLVTNKEVFKYILVIWLAYCFLGFLNTAMDSLTGHHILQIWELFQADSIIGYTGYFLLGYYLSCVSIKFTPMQNVSLFLLGGFTTILVCIFLSLREGSLNAHLLCNTHPQVILMASSLFLLVKDRRSIVSKSSSRFLDYFRSDLFGVYLTHAMWLTIINDIINKWAPEISHVYIIPVVTIVTFILSLYTTKLLRKLPLINKFVE